MGEAKNSFRVIHHLDENQIRELTELYQKEWWTTGRTFDQTNQLVKNSTVVIGIIDKYDEVIAFTRVLSDLVIKAIIFDVIVKEEYREHGLGAQLMELVFNHEEIRNVKHFELYCNDDMTSYYKKFDFRSLNDEMFYMRMENPSFQP